MRKTLLIYSGKKKKKNNGNLFIFFFLYMGHVNFENNNLDNCLCSWDKKTINYLIFFKIYSNFLLFFKFYFF